ncbi:hypothetical protein [Leptospira inadai]|uniref:Uncharacterized protein n=1 Tax=Leptospira inadai serovar Lyme TaxID=293084 RepID=A0ABX4YGG5_9LEPT|nr:hypothetical protein LEP1GSC047_0879 [Leptospira phage vB_LinZ_10-LE1]PNV74351.1 hypothetical protein BES34_014300 [Leptospira inadai serovar Lyme]
MNTAIHLSGSPHPGLIPKKIQDSRGRNITHWIKPGDNSLTPRERKVQDAKHARNSIEHTNQRSEKEKKLIKEMAERHMAFEEEAKNQRKTYGSGPQLPVVGRIMRVYAKGKVNVGGMLCKIKEIASDGKTAICELTSGKTYEFPLDHLQIAKTKTA